MDFLDIFFNIFFGLFLLLGVGSIIFGILMIFKPSFIRRQPPVLSDLGHRLSGILFVVVGLEFVIKNARYLLDVAWLDTDYLVSASAFLLFFVVIGISTVVGRPLLVTQLIPKLTSSRIFFGVLLIIWGILLFFKFSEDYWSLPDSIEDINFGALVFLLFFTIWYISRIRRQAN